MGSSYGFSIERDGCSVVLRPLPRGPPPIHDHSFEARLPWCCVTSVVFLHAVHVPAHAESSMQSMCMLSHLCTSSCPSQLRQLPSSMLMPSFHPLHGCFPLRSGRGDYIAIKVNSTVYEKHLKLCSHSLIGQAFFSKGEEP